MAKLCTCKSRCQHLVPGPDEPNLAADRLQVLDDDRLLRVLTDVAAAFDQDGLTVDEVCEVHGERPAPEGECCCAGVRYSALEFVDYLVVVLRASKTSRFEPGHRPRALQEQLNLSIAG